MIAAFAQKSTSGGLGAIPESRLLSGALRSALDVLRSVQKGKRLRRRHLFCMLAAAVTAAWAVDAFAQGTQQSIRPGHRSNRPGEFVLFRLLSEAQQGRCGMEMTPLVLASCEQQILYIQKRLQGLGRILSTNFVGLEPSQANAEVYQVYFANGRMVWMIGFNRDNSVRLFWTPG